jgi:radical SAM protein with 4Fe4S-binding SPASM domain
MLNREYSSIRLEITSKCNINCVYCHNSDYANKQDDLTTEEIIKLIKNMKKRYPINKILLTGGEPLLNNNIVEIVETISSLGIKADLVTNGKLLTRDKIVELSKAGLKRIRLSIDGLEEHKLFRKGSDPFELWDLAGFIVNETNIDLCIHTVCSSHNVNTLFDVYKKVLEVGANRWRIFDIGYKGSVIANKNIIDLENYYADLFNVSKKIIKEYIENNRKQHLDMEINNIFRTTLMDINYDEFKDLVIEEALQERSKMSPCKYINHQATIRSNGVSTFCQYHHRTIFDFKRYNFDVELAVNNANEVIENDITMGELEHCSKCKYCLVCNGGCRSRAEILTGDIRDADPASCFIQSLVRKEIMPLMPDNTQLTYNKLFNEDGVDPKYNAKDLEEFFKKTEFIF